MADIYNAFVQGRQQGEARRTKRTLSQHLQGALGGDQAALTQIYQADPNAGMSTQKLARETQNDSLEDVAKAATFFASTRDPKAYSYLQQRLSSMPQFAGLPATLDTPEDQEGAVKFAQSLAQTYGGGGEGNNVQSRFIDDQGNMVALMRDASTRVVGKADPNYQIIEAEGGFYGANRRNLQAAPVQLGGGQPPMPQQGAPIQQGPQMPAQGPAQRLDPVMDFPDLSSRYGAQVSSLRRDPGRNSGVGGVPNSYHLTGEAGDFVVPQDKKQAFIADAQSRGYQAIDEGDHIHVEPPNRGMTASQFGQGQQLRPAAKTISPAEERRLQLAEEAAQRAREAAERSRLGNAPAGFRFRPDGSLEPIPGAPNATTNDGERGAFGYLGRMQAAEKLLSGIEAEGYEPGGYRDTTAANNAGMRILGPLFNAATSPQGQKYRQAQEDWVRAKLRKESGAVIGDDEMAREIRVYFAQPGDDPGVIQQKAAARLQAEQQLRSMAGRAAPAGQQAAPGARPAVTPGPKRVQSAADYDALPSGALFIAPDGTQRRKR